MGAARVMGAVGIALACAACGGQTLPAATDGGASPSDTGVVDGAVDSARTGDSASATDAPGDAAPAPDASADAGAIRDVGVDAPPNRCTATFFPQDDGGCACPGGALAEVPAPDGGGYLPGYRTPDDGGPAVLQPNAQCVCQPGQGGVCPDDAGAEQCVTLETDPDNCGACGVGCPPASACNAGKCGPEPTVLVPPAPGCASIHLAVEGSTLYWADLGHGTVSSVPTTGGPVTTMASGLHLSVIEPDLSAFLGVGPIGAPIVVHQGTVYGIETSDPTFDDAGSPTGLGSSIFSVTAGEAPKTLLPAALVPGPTAVDTFDQWPEPLPIRAIAVSPDGSTLDFALGADFYSMPATGAVTSASLRYLGYNSGPDGYGGATSLATDGRYVWFGDCCDDALVGLLDTTAQCAPFDLDASVASRWPEPQCPTSVAYGGFGDNLPDTLVLQDDVVYWASGPGNNILGVSLAATLDSGLGPGVTFPAPLDDSQITGFVIGAGVAYFGENGYVEMAGASQNGVQPLELARHQPEPSSFAFDGTRIFWTTSDCDIRSLDVSTK